MIAWPRIHSEDPKLRLGRSGCALRFAEPFVLESIRQQFKTGSFHTPVEAL